MMLARVNPANACIDTANASSAATIEPPSDYFPSQFKAPDDGDIAPFIDTF